MLHRQGKITFHISGIGQEAAQVGAVYAIEKSKDWLAPYYRDLSMMIAMGMSPAQFVMSLMGKAEEPTPQTTMTAAIAPGRKSKNIKNRTRSS